VAIASVLPQDSPGGAPGAPYLRGITRLETAVHPGDLDDLVSNGVNVWFNSTANGGFIMLGGVTTRSGSGSAGQTELNRARMYLYITSSVSEFMERFLGRLLDINLATQSFGDVTRRQKAEVESFLDGLKTNKVISDWAVDWFGENTALGLATGRFIVPIYVRLFASQREIVIYAAIGQTVTFSLAA
jgi:hypothetical protein